MMSNGNDSELDSSLIRCVILGGGGHTKGLIDSIVTGKLNYEIVGILDPDKEKFGTDIQDVKVIGGDEMLKSLLTDGVQHFIVGLGGTGNCRPRMRLYSHALEIGLKPLSVIHPTAYLSSFAELGIGLQVMPHVTVMPGVKIMDDVILNTGAIVEHDCSVGSHCHISSGAHLAGDVTIGNCTHIGIGSVVRQGANIGDYVVIGAGSVVVKDIPSNLTVVGNPASVLKKRN